MVHLLRKKDMYPFGNEFFVFFFLCRAGVWVREASGMSSEMIKSSTGKWAGGLESPSRGARPVKR